MLLADACLRSLVLCPERVSRVAIALLNWPPKRGSHLLSEFTSRLQLGWLNLCLSVCLSSVCLSVCIYLSVCPVCLSVCVCVCLSVSLRPPPPSSSSPLSPSPAPPPPPSRSIADFRNNAQLSGNYWPLSAAPVGQFRQASKACDVLK